MSEQVTIHIDGREVKAEKGQMLIEVTDALGTYVPRFCYHKKLTVAANCRMCLVEVEKAAKPLPACATPVTDGMRVSTRSDLALQAQQSVMEFLLINHPLDCPVCDQGGECELQDLAMGYGSDVSRYQENKRVVQDKDIGPLVQTEMTRCIHCTRCVRFGEEVAGLRELGATGRGEFMEIGTYIEKSMVSELSGNVIDLCPVGALTSKPFRFSARAWEMSQRPGIAIHDSLGSNLHFHIKDNQVKRVVPAENETLNEIWLSDRDRFSYQGLDSGARLTEPMIRQHGKWQTVSWETAFDTIKQNLGDVIRQHGADRVGGLISPASTTEELYLMQKLLRGLGSANIDHRLRQADFSDQDQAPLWPTLGQQPAALEQVDAALIVGGNPRKDQPLLNLRLRKAALSGAKIMSINPVAEPCNYTLHTRCTVADMVTTVAAVLKAAQEQQPNGISTELEQLLARTKVDASHRDIATALGDAERGTILLGTLAMSDPRLAQLRYLCGMLARTTGAVFGYLGEAANTVGAWQAGAVPHRLCGGEPSPTTGLNARQMLAAPRRTDDNGDATARQPTLSAYILCNLDPQLDCLDGGAAAGALSAADCVIALTPYRHPLYQQHAHILLPQALFAENEGSIVNINNITQQQTQAITPPDEARPAWQILNTLGNTLRLDGFTYTQLAEIQAEFKNGIADKQADNNSWREADTLLPLNSSLQRAGYIPMNSVDALVRHAPALQQTEDIASPVAQLNAATAAALHLTLPGTIRLSQDERQMELPAVINEAVADNCVLLHGAHPDTAALGPLCGAIGVEALGNHA
ncbi:MAG: NADH-quinone oxidoreductase subunit NuoG [Gammaproteobacteria bacterium]